MRVEWVALALALAGCSTRQEARMPDSSAATSAAVSDTLRGTVSIVGSEPATMVSVRPVDGSPAIIVSGDALPELRRAAGTEVLVAGKRTDERSMNVETFEVRAIHGMPVIDGVIARDGDSYVLVTQDGKRTAVPRLPAELRGQVGARVWLAGQPDRDPELFGVITPPN